MIHSAMEVCELCGRQLGEHSVEFHHLIPKRFGGKATIPLHRMCHRKIHTVFTDKELLHYYNTVGRLLENEEIQRFITWIQKKPLYFYDSSKDTAMRRKKRTYTR